MPTFDEINRAAIKAHQEAAKPKKEKPAPKKRAAAKPATDTGAE